MAKTRLHPVFRFVAVLYAGLGLTVVLCWGELRWSAREISRMIGGDVGQPLERRLYREAQWNIEKDRDLERAGELLRQALAIDPTCEAGYWLAEYYLATGQTDQALAQLQHYVTIDPTRSRAWIQIAALLERQGRIDQARVWLDRGLRHFRRYRDGFEPRTVPGLPREFNEKAVLAYRDYFEGTLRLEQEIARLEGLTD